MRTNSFSVNRGRLQLVDEVVIVGMDDHCYDREYFLYFNKLGMVHVDLCEQRDHWTAYLVTVTNGREYNQWHTFPVKPSRQTVAIRCNSFLKSIP